MSKVRQWLYLKDEEGVPIEDAYLRLYLTGTKTEATIFSDSIGTSLDQSTWTSATSGFFDFYIGNEWDPQGYTANQYFDLAWSLSPFVTDGDMENDPTNSWTAINSSLAEETTIVRSGSKSLKVIDTGLTSSAYQMIPTEIGVKYRVTGYTYVPSVADIDYSNMVCGKAPSFQEYGYVIVTTEDSWVLMSLDFTAETTTTYIHLGCTGKIDDWSDYCFFDDISIEKVISKDNSGVIEKIQLFPFIFSVDETDTDSDKNKVLNNQLAYKFENHVDNRSYPTEPHNIKPVDTNDPNDSTYDKVVTNNLMNDINGLLNLLLTCGGDAISVTSSGSLVETVLLDTFTPSGDGYYTDLVHTINRGRKYPILQFYEYLSDGYKGRPPVLGSPSAGSNQIIHPRAIQDQSADTIRVWTTNENWLMATVVASGS